MCAGKYNPFEVAEASGLKIRVAEISLEREKGSDHRLDYRIWTSSRTDGDNIVRAASS